MIGKTYTWGLCSRRSLWSTVSAVDGTFCHFIHQAEGKIGLATSYSAALALRSGWRSSRTSSDRKPLVDRFRRGWHFLPLHTPGRGQNRTRHILQRSSCASIRLAQFPHVFRSEAFGRPFPPWMALSATSYTRPRAKSDSPHLTAQLLRFDQVGAVPARLQIGSLWSTVSAVDGTFCHFIHQAEGKIGLATSYSAALALRSGWRSSRTSSDRKPLVDRFRRGWHFLPLHTPGRGQNRTRHILQRSSCASIRLAQFPHVF